MKTTQIDKVFLGIAIGCGLVGFSNIGSEVVDGLGRAMFGVFMILFFIARFTKNERMDGEDSAPQAVERKEKPSGHESYRVVRRAAH